MPWAFKLYLKSHLMLATIEENVDLPTAWQVLKSESHINKKSSPPFFCLPFLELGLLNCVPE